MRLSPYLTFQIVFVFGPLGFTQVFIDGCDPDTCTRLPGYCKEGWVHNRTQICQPCHPACARCLHHRDDGCYTCSDGYYKPVSTRWGFGKCVACSALTYGEGCNQRCHCLNGIQCNKTTGFCPSDMCDPNFPDCQESLNGYLTTWGGWGGCSKTCGRGSRSRSRSCVPPRFGGRACSGSLTSTSQCNTNNCTTCPVPWKKYLDKWGKQSYCFKANKPFSTRTYAEASEDCMDMNSKLATHHDDGVDEMFPSDGVARWIGVEYDHNLAMYAYNDGVPMDTSWLSWTPWGTAGDHPSNGWGSLECTVITDGKWRSVRCTDTFEFVCEYQICPHGWTYNPHVDRCNKFFLTPATFEIATNSCSRHGAIIETARSLEAERFLFDLGGTDHIHLRGQNLRGRALWLGVMNIADETIWRWNDGAKVTWTAWDGTSRSDISSEKNQNCMYALRRDDSTVAVWKRTVCVRFPMFYVCGKATCRFPYQSIVAEGHFPFYHKCYRGMMNARLNARQAGQFCAEDGSESNPSRLAAPITKLEEDILHKRYEDRYMFYNHGSYNYDEKWIGYTFNIYEGGENWQWNDNTIGLGLPDKAKYNDNEHVATNGRYYLESCTVLRANTWMTKECDYIYGFICEREQPYVLSTCLPSKNARLMDGYYPNVPQSQRMKCYYLNADPKVMNYAEADRFCSSIGGYIMMPKTNHDLMRITNQLSRTKPKYFWIGADSFGHCFNKNYWCTPNKKHFKYQDGSNFTSNKLSWNIGEPNNLKHKEACIDVHRDNHHIKDYDCSKLRAVVCEIAHNNLRAHRNFDYITACKYKKALPEGKWYADIEKPRSNGPWHAAPDDVCYRTPGRGRGFKRYVYSCSSLEKDSDTARPRGKDQTRSLVLSILSTGATTSSYIGVFYWRPHANEVKWLVKSYYGMTTECSGPGTTSATCNYGWAEASLRNWIPGNTVPTNYNKGVVIKPNGKWVSVHFDEWNYVSCQKPGVASLSTWRRHHLLSLQSERVDSAAGPDRLHSDSRSVAMVIIASFALCALNGVY